MNPRSSPTRILHYSSSSVNTAQVGSIVIDEQAGRRLALNLWQSERHATAALSILRPEVGRLLNPLISTPSELISVGPVLPKDLLPNTHA